MGFDQDIRVISLYIKVEPVESKRHDPLIMIVHNGKFNDGLVRPDETFLPWLQVISEFVTLFLCQVIIFECEVNHSVSFVPLRSKHNSMGTTKKEFAGAYFAKLSVVVGVRTDYQSGLQLDIVKYAQRDEREQHTIVVNKAQRLTSSPALWAIPVAVLGRNR